MATHVKLSIEMINAEGHVTRFSREVAIPADENPPFYLGWELGNLAIAVQEFFPNGMEVNEVKDGFSGRLKAE